MNSSDTSKRPVHRQRRATLAREVAGLERYRPTGSSSSRRGTRAPKFTTQARLGARQLHRVGEVGRHVDVDDFLARLARMEARGLQVSAEPPASRRPAARCSTARNSDRRSRIGIGVDGAHGMPPVVRRSVQRQTRATSREVVEVGAVALGLAVHAVRRRRSDVVEVALDAGDEAIRLVTDVVLASAAFDVAPADQQVRRCRPP